MSEKQKIRILAVYYIYVNAGLNISDSMKKIVDQIENERAAAAVAKA